MKIGFDWLARPLLFSFEPETAHAMSIAALRTGLPLGMPSSGDYRLRVEVAGLSLANPLGMAAGYDKNAEVPDGLLGLGFGFVEVGTVTPLAQEGNPKPRIFRLGADHAVINRLGFNNDGHDEMYRRLTARRQRAGVVGVNIGANKDSADRIADYRLGVERFGPLASYLTVNISSPNTPGLRSLQDRESLAALLIAVMDARNALPGSHRPPVFLKIAPDLVDAQIKDIAEEVLDKKVDGVIVSNTTLSRRGVSGPHLKEAGGLSGRPLFSRSTAVLARVRRLVGPSLPLIGVGGIDSGASAAEKIRAGADLVQLYTGLIYGGPWLPSKILRELSGILDQEKVSSISALRNSRLDHWAKATIE
jgi:dihydroorotate dehydrogenase